MEINEFVRTFGVLTNGRPTSKVVKLVRPAAPCLVHEMSYRYFPPAVIVLPHSILPCLIPAVAA